MNIGGKDLLAEIESKDAKLGIYLRSYVLPALQSRGLAGHVLATPPDAPGNVELQPISTLAAQSNPPNSTYVGTGPSGAIIASPNPVTPGNTPLVAHEWIDSYDSTTGVLTQSQPDFTDISGVAVPIQIGTGTPAAGDYVDGGTGAWTPLPTGLTVVIVTAALTGGGTQGSMTFTNGRLTAQVQAT